MTLERCGSASALAEQRNRAMIVTRFFTAALYQIRLAGDVKSVGQSPLPGPISF
jgi:hypothetical protein